MRALVIATLVGLALSVPAVAIARAHGCTGASGRLCHLARVSARHRRLANLRHALVARGYHIPRFDQGEAEDFVHTAYPYRTGLYVPWPDAYGAPYPY